MIAVLCLFLKRMRGLATFSLFHILLGAIYCFLLKKQMFGYKYRAQLAVAEPQICKYKSACIVDLRFCNRE